MLFKEAESLEEYADRDTLKHRVCVLFIRKSSPTSGTASFRMGLLASISAMVSCSVVEGTAAILVGRTRYTHTHSHSSCSHSVTLQAKESSSKSDDPMADDPTDQGAGALRSQGGGPK